jgi:hypothetical protein
LALYLFILNPTEADQPWFDTSKHSVINMQNPTPTKNPGNRRRQKTAVNPTAQTTSVPQAATTISMARQAVAPVSSVPQAQKAPATTSGNGD